MFGTKPNRDFLMLEIYNKDNARFFLLQNMETLVFANFQNLYDFYNKEKIHILPNIETLTFANFQILQNTK